MFKTSPNFARKGHQQITGSEADEKDRIIAGVQFVVRYIGSTEVASANGTGSGKTEKPVAHVFDQQRRKENGKTHKKLILTLCSKNLSVTDEACGKLIASFPISKITFCNLDKFYEKAFVFVARDKPENPFKAFVFTCESKTKAREAFKALSLAFIINYECYQASLARCAPNGKGTTGDRSPNSDEQKSNFLNRMADAGFDAGKESSLQFPSGNGPSNKESIPTTLRKFPVKNETVLITDCRKHTRSASDPSQIGKTRTPNLTPSPLITVTATNNSKDGEMEEEFTEFAELRSKCRSSSAIFGNNHAGSTWEGFQLCEGSAPNVWPGGFQGACPPIY